MEQWIGDGEGPRCLAVKVDTTNGKILKQSVNMQIKVKLSVKLKSESGAVDQWKPKVILSTAWRRKWKWIQHKGCESGNKSESEPVEVQAGTKHCLAVKVEDERGCRHGTQ